MQGRAAEEETLTITEQKTVLIIAPAAFYTEDLIHWIVPVIAQVEVWVIHVWPLHVTGSAHALLPT